MASSAPTALFTPGIRRSAAMSSSAIVLLMRSSVCFCATVKSAVPTRSSWVAVTLRELVSTPRATTAVTPIATAAAVSPARSGRPRIWRRTSPRNVTAGRPAESVASSDHGRSAASRGTRGLGPHPGVPEWPPGPCPWACTLRSSRAAAEGASDGPTDDPRSDRAAPRRGRRSGTRRGSAGRPAGRASAPTRPGGAGTGSWRSGRSGSRPRARWWTGGGPGNRVGDEGEATQSELGAFAGRVDLALVGLGN